MFFTTSISNYHGIAPLPVADTSSLTQHDPILQYHHWRLVTSSNMFHLGRTFRLTSLSDKQVLLSSWACSAPSNLGIYLLVFSRYIGISRF